MPEEDNACCTGSVETLILACSGSSNVGQISNRAMIALDRNGIGRAFCLTGVGADLSGFVESARAANTVLIDGCAVGCGKKVLERHGISPTRYIVLTELGIEKKHNLDNLEAEAEDALKRIL